MPVAVDLPDELVAAIEESLGKVDRAALARSTASLSERYRAGEAGGRPVARSPADVLAYAAYRLPATFAALSAAMREIREQRRGWEPRTLLDLGAGPGTAAWAAARTWPSLERVDAVDAVPEMIALGSRLASSAPHPAVRSARWTLADLGAPPELERHDLVVLSYVLGELEPASVDDVLGRAWAAAGDLLLVVEPGTPRGYANVIAARAALLRAGGFTTGPCPHDAPCPMGGGDWCHFAVRLARTVGHRAAKAATLGHEDEKFSWAALSRVPTSRAAARILRHPQSRSGHVRLELCTPAGLRSAVVSKRDRDLYRRARKAAWGESFPAAVSAGGPSELQTGPPTAEPPAPV